MIRAWLHTLTRTAPVTRVRNDGYPAALQPVWAARPGPPGPNGYGSTSWRVPGRNHHWQETDRALDTLKQLMCARFRKIDRNNDGICEDFRTERLKRSARYRKTDQTNVAELTFRITVFIG
ncbi:hypothetical protein [Mycobacterium sp. MS1601]|uniref:hypothetical protein n=1 Tax=Mycobacterium sp. MS1601 TaxID=1936029 RepID=UPI0012F7FBAD|nr:hypothetical protein [Mycobacterium sp. MS1601]